MPLPKMKVSFKDAKKLKGGSELAKKYSLNSLPEFRQNGCKMLTVEASPLDYDRMGQVWSYFLESGNRSFSLHVSIHFKERKGFEYFLAMLQTAIWSDFNSWQSQPVLIVACIHLQHPVAKAAQPRFPVQTRE